MNGRPVEQIMYFLRNSTSLIILDDKNIAAHIQYGSVNTGEEMDSLLRSMTGVFVPLLTQ